MSNELDKLVAGATADLVHQQEGLVSEELARWQTSADWADLSDEDHAWFSAKATNLAVEADNSLDGLKKILRHDYSINNQLRDLSGNVGKKAVENRTAKLRVSELNGGGNEQKSEVSEAEVLVPKIFTSIEEVDLLIAELNKLRARLADTQQVRITWKEVN